MGRTVYVSVTYLFTIEEENIKNAVPDMDDDELAEAARMQLYDLNMNDFEPNDIEVEVLK